MIESVSPTRAPEVATDFTIELTVRAVRLKRRRCPRCGRVRVGFKLVAYGKQAVGEGASSCGPCAGLR